MDRSLQQLNSNVCNVITHHHLEHLVGCIVCRTLHNMHSKHFGVGDIACKLPDHLLMQLVRRIQLPNVGNGGCVRVWTPVGRHFLHLVEGDRVRLSELQDVITGKSKGSKQKILMSDGNTETASNLVKLLSLHVLQNTVGKCCADHLAVDAVHVGI